MLSPFTIQYFNYVAFSSINFAVFIYLFRRLCVFCCHLPRIKYCMVCAVCSADPLFHHPSMFSQRSPFCWLRHITRSVFRELVWQQEWERKGLKIGEEPEGGGGKKQLPKKLKDKAWKRRARRQKKRFALGLLQCWCVCVGQLGGKNQGLFVSGMYNIHMVYIQHSINAVMIIQQTCCSDRGTQPVGRLRICSRARPAINQHFRYKFNHQSRRRMCISNIQRPLASERPMCPILLIRLFDKQFRL